MGPLWIIVIILVVALVIYLLFSARRGPRV